jgi:hypothetical protein
VPTIVIERFIDKKSKRLFGCFLRDSSAKQNGMFVLAGPNHRDS